MTTLITGSSGFVGLALTEELLRTGNHVVGFDTMSPSREVLDVFAALPGKFSLCAGDVRDPATLEAALCSHRCENLVILAAVTADESRERQQPALIYEVNVAGALNSIQIAARHGVSRFVHVSSGSVYGKSGYTGTPLNETDTPLLPEGLYGHSKQAAETAILRLQSLYAIDLVIGRLGTCFGPWEHDTGFRDTLSAPLQILELARRRQIAVLPRDSVRDWLYVRDAAAGIVSLIKTPQLPHDIYNIAAGFEFSLSSWCRKLQAQMPNFQWRVAEPGEPCNVRLYGTQDRSSMDIGRLLADTQFEPSYDLDTAFDDFISWNQTIENLRISNESFKQGIEFHEDTGQF